MDLRLMWTYAKYIYYTLFVVLNLIVLYYAIVSRERHLWYFFFQLFQYTRSGYLLFRNRIRVHQAIWIHISVFLWFLGLFLVVIGMRKAGVYLCYAGLSISVITCIISFFRGGIFIPEPGANGHAPHHLHW